MCLLVQDLREPDLAGRGRVLSKSIKDPVKMSEDAKEKIQSGER